MPRSAPIVPKSREPLTVAGRTPTQGGSIRWQFHASALPRSGQNSWNYVSTVPFSVLTALERENFMPTTDRLRHDIDRGRGGDKVDNVDPAAAPLGTDDEAAGNSPTSAEIKLAHKHEVGRKVSSERGGRDSDHGVAIWVAVVMVWSGVLFSAIYFLQP
jgi:hypothetical protein